MSEQGNRRPLLLALTGVAATVILVFAYQRYHQHPAPTAGSSLRRSNAVRRSRRQSRRDYTLNDPDSVYDHALSRLQQRIDTGRSYGRYDNRALFTVDEGLLDRGVFDLLPGNVAQIYAMLVSVRRLTDSEKEMLKLHINSLFVQNFLHQEFPPGYILGEEYTNMLVQHLATWDIDERSVRMMTQNFNAEAPLIPEHWALEEEPQLVDSDTVPQADGPTDRDSRSGRVTAQDAIDALTGSNTRDGSDTDGGDADSDPGGSQNMLDLLYHIASEQAKREGFIHRDVECNSCGVKPIQGVRYHCANCFDYDLCEDCEAQQVHNKSHVFYKVRIPAPPRGHIKQVAPVWYPGHPNAFPSSMPRDLQRCLVEDWGVEKTEMEASYEQFKCLAGQEIPVETDPAHLGMAISRKNFDMFFTPTSADRPPPPNLIYDRIFAFYDFRSDGVISLDEYIIGIHTILDKSRGARLKRMFMGYDLDGDGYVDRKDFLRMFRAWYALSKELNREVIFLQDDLDDDIRDVVQGSQPVSAAFSGHYFVGHASRGGQDKEADAQGDLEISQGPDGVLQNDLEIRGERSRAIGNAAVRDRTRTHPFRSFRQPPESDEQLLFLPFSSYDRGETNIPFAEDVADEELVGPDPSLHVYGWPPQQPPTSEDVVSALGVEMSLEDVTDPIDRSRVIYAQSQRMDDESDRILNNERAAAVQERWRRRRFYIDEEEGLSKPPGYTEPDSSGDEDVASIDQDAAPAAPALAGSRRQSMRSRSSSKVRFDDSAIDTDYETRSNTSSRSIPVNERWGGYELGEPERDVGRDILYQAAQQGFNELVDPLFRKIEDEAMEAIASKSVRLRWAKELDDYEQSLKKKADDEKEALKQADLLRTEALLSSGINDGSEAPEAADVASPLVLTPETDHDETDHIQIMFGNSNAERNSTTATDLTPVVESLSSIVEEHGAQIDPTLPQNKPNDPAFNLFTPSSIDLSRTGSQRSSIDSSFSGPAPTPPLAVLQAWARHRKIDGAAKRRGGYGKLSYREFRRAMVQEADRHQNTDSFDDSGNDKENGNNTDRNAPLRDSRNRGDNGDHDGADDDSDSDEDDDEATWSSTAGLGKLEFCGVWLDMAQF